MKRNHFFFAALAIAAMTCFLPSCGDDDQDVKPGKGSDASGWFKAEDKTTEFKYGYLFSDEDGTVAVYYTIDALDMMMNPSKYNGKTFSAFACGVDGEYFFEATINTTAKVDIYGDGMYGVGGMIYDSIGDAEYTVKKSGSSYTIEGTDLLAAITIETGDFENDDFDYEELGSTVVDFRFTGKPKNMGYEGEGYDDDTRSIPLVKVTDPEMAKKLMNLVKRHGK